MVDSDRDRDTTERTTIVETDRGGGGGVLAIVLLIILLLALLFFFRDDLGLTGGDTTEVEVPEQIDVNIN
jgi:hypothetical protein